MTEKRHFQRIRFDGKVEFETGDMQQVCELVDISFKGALITCGGNTDLATDAACRLTLTLDEAADVRITMDGEIAYKLDDRVGIHCKGLDLDSMTHLRKLVELNLGDEELLQREFDALVMTISSGG